MVGGFEGRPQAGDAPSDDDAVREELAGRDRIDVHEVPAGLAETDRIGRRRALPLALFIHTHVALPVGDSENASNRQVEKEKDGATPSCEYDSPPRGVATPSPQSQPSYPNLRQVEIQKQVGRRAGDGPVRVLSKDDACVAPTGPCGPGPGRSGRAARRRRTSPRIPAIPWSRRSGSGGRPPFHASRRPGRPGSGL